MAEEKRLRKRRALFVEKDLCGLRTCRPLRAEGQCQREARSFSILAFE